MFVEIPIIEQHEGLDFYVRRVEIAELCPVCGMPRGKNTIHKVRSYDGILLGIEDFLVLRTVL